MAPLTENDRTLIPILRIEKHLNAYQMIKEFPARNWSKSNLILLSSFIGKIPMSDRTRIHACTQFEIKC